MTQSGNWWANGSQPAPQAYLQYMQPPSLSSWNPASGAINLLTFSLILSEEWDEPAEVTEHPVEVGANITDHVRVGLEKCTLKVFNSNEPLVESVNLGSYNLTPTRGPISIQVNPPSWTTQSLTLQYPVWDNPILARAALQAATGAIGGAVGGVAGGVVGSVAGGLLGALLLSAHETTEAQRTTAGLQPPPTYIYNASVDQWPGGPTGGTDFVTKMHALLSSLKSAAQPFYVWGTKKQLFPMLIDDLSFSRANEDGSGESVTISLKEVRTVATQTVPAPIPNLPAGGGTPTVSHGGQDPAPAPQVSAASMLASGVGSLVPASVQAVLPSVFGGSAGAG